MKHRKERSLTPAERRSLLLSGTTIAKPVPTPKQPSGCAKQSERVEDYK